MTFYQDVLRYAICYDLSVTLGLLKGGIVSRLDKGDDQAFNGIKKLCCVSRRSLAKF